MGAWFDSRIATGKTPAEAFKTAVESAQWEHGHGGYSGTIAEKRDYVLVTLPARMTAAKFQALVVESADHIGQDVDWNRERLQGAKTAAERRKIETQIRREVAADAKFWKAIPVHARDTVARARQIADDKWGPAVMVEVSAAEARAARTTHNLKRGTKVFRIFGYCSS